MDHELVVTHRALTTKCSDYILVTDLSSMTQSIWYSLRRSRNYLPFIQPKSSLLCLQGSHIDPCCVQSSSANPVDYFTLFLILSPTLRLSLQIDLIPLGIEAKISYAFIMSLACITCTVDSRYTRFHYPRFYFSVMGSINVPSLVTVDVTIAHA
jgi:hypothetical protein